LGNSTGRKRGRDDPWLGGKKRCGKHRKGLHLTSFSHDVTGGRKIQRRKSTTTKRERGKEKKKSKRKILGEKPFNPSRNEKAELVRYQREKKKGKHHLSSSKRKEGEEVPYVAVNSPSFKVLRSEKGPI